MGIISAMRWDAPDSGERLANGRAVARNRATPAGVVAPRAVIHAATSSLTWHPARNPRDSFTRNRIFVNGMNVESRSASFHSLHTPRNSRQLSGGVMEKIRRAISVGHVAADAAALGTSAPRSEVRSANVGVELKGVRSGVERRRGVCVGIESEGWAERNDGKKSP